MKNSLLTFLFIFLANLISAQNYGHTLLMIPEQNLLPAAIYQFQDRFFVPTIYPDTISSVISFDQDAGDRIDFIYDNFTFASHPYTRIGDQFFFYAKDRSIDNDLRIRKQNTDFETLWERTYEVSEDYSFPVTMLSIDNHLYITALNQRNEPYQRMINLKKIDTLGNVVWSKNYGEDLQRSLAYHTKITMDENILMSAKRDVYDLSIPPHSQLIKVDTAGNILWHAIGMERFPNGATKTSVTELSNGQIIQAYAVYKRETFDFITLGWYEEPTRMDWYDAEGNFLFYKYILSPNTTSVGIIDLINGRGDYFFAIGSSRELGVGIHHGLITKMNHQGDTIWAKKYQYPSVDQFNELNSFRDMIELENGDLVTVGTAWKVGTGEFAPVWIMRVNEYGCFGGDNCDDIVTSVESIDGAETSQISIYPNPAQDLFTVELTDLTEVRIYDLTGKKQIEQLGNTGNREEVDISGLTKGTYILSATRRDGKVWTELVVVE